MSRLSFGFQGRTFSLGNLRDLDLQVEDYRRKKGGLSIVGSHRLLFLSFINSIEILAFGKIKGVMILELLNILDLYKNGICAFSLLEMYATYFLAM
jgi:hypothetical protein